MHNLKGLAPMMGKASIGNVAKHLDSILKKIISGKKVDGIFEPICVSIEKMQLDMKSPHEMSEIQKQISEMDKKLVD